VELSIEVITLLIFGTLFLLLAIGVPVAFALGTVGVGYTVFLWGPPSLFNMAVIIFKNMSSGVLLAIPLFLLMANFLQHSGIADTAYGAIHRWMGPVRGGLAMGTVLICTVFAAMSGVSGAATVTMGLIAIPSMLKRNYDKRIAVGCVAAGGVLGIVIPPSVIMILYASVTRESVGGLFFGGIIPGLMIAAGHITYIGIRSYLQPHMAPSIAPEERVGMREKLVSLRAIVLPVLLILLVLGSIWTGAATPTEAAGVGALGALICVVIYRRANWQVLNDSIRTTLRITCMVMWIVAAATAFNSLYVAIGARELVTDLILSLEVNRWIILIGMQLTLFFFGCIMDDYAIVMLCAPIYVPIIKILGFDPLWFGILFILNMQMAYLTPPYGFNLFYLKGIVPKGVTMGDIYRSIVPFVLLQGTGLVLVMIFPQLALFLPNKMVFQG